MNLTTTKIFFGILIFDLITNLLVCIDFQHFFLRAIITFIFLTFIPGLLMMLILKIREISFWEYLVYTIGLSIAFLMFGGLLINWSLPLININQPLSLQPLLICFNIFILILALIAYFRNINISLKIKLIKVSRLNWIFLIIPIIFLILSILGVISLNNHGTNFFTMLMLGSIAVYVVLVIIYREKLNANVLPISIFFIALSLLFMTSLRGWYITGHDIQPEYYVFQLTKINLQWNISLYQDAYNACLSLNILPTIYYSFLNINDIYIFKIIFQIIFSFSTISIFLIFKRYSVLIVAFLATFYYISFPTFLNDMPMLNRQEIALLFFALMIMVLFNKTIRPRLKEIMFLIFGFSMIVSHYSTSYIAIAILVSTYFLSIILKRKFIKEKLKIGGSYYLTGVMVLGLVIFTFIWNTQLTKSSSGLTQLITQSWQNINKSFSQDLKSEDVLYSLFSWQKLDKSKQLNEYVQLSTQEIELSKERALYYDKGVYDKYKIILLEDEVLPLTSLGKKLTSIAFNVYQLNYYLRQGVAKLVQILLIIGFVVIFLRKSRYLLTVDSEYNVLALVSIILLGLLIFLPMFSIEYGTLRFFQQILIFLALPAIIGGIIIFNFLNEKIRLYFAASIFIASFLSLSGFIPQLTGGYYPLLNLNNQGIYYDDYYTHKTEVDSIKWLSDHNYKKYPIQSSIESGSKMLATARLRSLEKMLPVTIRKDAYVFLDYANVNNKRNTVSFNQNSISYYYPADFLEDNKDLIYNNLGSQIFK